MSFWRSKGKGPFQLWAADSGANPKQGSGVGSVVVRRSPGGWGKAVVGGGGQEGQVPVLRKSAFLARKTTYMGGDPPL